MIIWLRTWTLEVGVWAIFKVKTRLRLGVGLSFGVQNYGV